MKLKFAAMGLALIACLASSPSNASTLTYDLVLNSTTGQIDGTFGVTGPVPNSGPSGPLQITSLSLTVGGTLYNFVSLLITPFATFSNGALTSIQYLGAADNFKLDLGTVGLGYMFADALNPSLSSIGTVSATATPLPSGLPLLMTGLGVLGLLRWRKGRQSHQRGQLQAA